MSNVVYLSLTHNLERLLEWMDERAQSSTDGGSLSPTVDFGAGEFLAVTNARVALKNALKNPPTTPRVEITMHGGLISEVRSDVPVRVVDYDTDGTDLNRIEQDADGADCVVSEYPASMKPFKIKR